jgi:hypothetical protein
VRIRNQTPTSKLFQTSPRANPPKTRASPQWHRALSGKARPMQRPRPAHGRHATQNASAADSSRRSATNWEKRSRSPDALRPRHRTQRHAAPNGLTLPSAPIYCRFSRLANYLVTQPEFRSRAPAPKRTGGTYSLPSPRPAAAATHPTRAPPLVALLLLPFFSIPITALLRTARTTRK